MTVTAAPVSAAPERSAVTGTHVLLRATLKHDGRKFAPWVAIATLLSASSVLVYPFVFPTEQDRQALAAAVGANPALGLIFGPANDLTTADGFNAWRTLALGGFLAALGAILAVTRATRGQEDSGQAELLAASVMGRGTRLLAGVGMALIGSVMLGLVAGLVTVACGGDFESSMLLAATYTATGWMFAAVAAVAAQIGSDARTASSIAVGTLGTLFLLRGFLYSIEAPEWTTWVNPLGWMTETKPASGNHWWPLLLAVAFTGIVLALAFTLQSRRDFGQGAVAPRPGPARGKVRSTRALAAFINRGPFITWSIAFVAIGSIFGFFTASVPDLLGSNSSIQQLLASGATTPEDLAGAFLVTILSLVGIIASVAGVQVMVKVRSEELEDRVEPVIATAIRRQRYWGSNVRQALLTSTVCVVIAGTLISLLASRADLGLTFGDAFLQVLATVPAVWTVVAVSVAVVGARPHVIVAAWVGVLLSFVLTLLGPTFGLPDWALGISPFWHVPHTGAESVDWSGLAWISLFTLGFIAVGFGGFRRRDLAR